MKIGIFGGAGLIGTLLAERLKNQHEVVIFDRHRPGLSGVDYQQTDVLATAAVPSKLAGCGAVINLCGRPIFGWPQPSKQAKYRSRVETTEKIVGWMSQMATKPAVFICANAVGYYGDHGDEQITEETPASKSELSRLCQNWQAAALGAEKLGIRTVVMRQGVVITPTGGVLAMIRPFFKLGLGATIGNRQAWFSWIGGQDLAAAYELALTNSKISGAINVVSPEPTRQDEFIAPIAAAWHRPVLWHLPKFIGRLILGSAVEEITASRRVSPAKLLSCGFHFRQTKLVSAMRPTN